MNISNEHLLLINILNTMYNDNNRQIQNLTNQNNHIISIITEILLLIDNKIRIVNKVRVDNLIIEIAILTITKIIWVVYF